MAGGVAFDPAEFEAFKARSSAPAGRGPSSAPSWQIPGDAPPANAPAASGGFDPAEFAAWKASSSRRPVEPASFDDRFGSGPMSAATDGSSDPLGQGLRRTADERLVGKPGADTPWLAAGMRAGNATLMNLPRNAAAAIKTARDGGGFTENYELLRDQDEALGRQSPKAALAGTVGGIVGGAMTLPAFRAAEGAGLGARAFANLKTGAMYGGISEFADTKDAFDAAKGAGVGGALGAGGGYAIEKLAPVVMGLFRRGVPLRDASGNLTEQASAALREVGVDPAAITPELEAAFRAKGPSPAVAREALAAEQGIPLSRGQATQDPVALGLESSALAGQRGGRAQGIGDDFAARQAAAIDAARGRLQGMAARGAPVIDNPAAAFEGIADRARQAGAGYADDLTRAQGAQAEALRAVRGSAPTDVLDGTEQAVLGARDAAGRSRQAYGQAYDDLDAIEGQFVPDAFGSRAAQRIRGMLGPDTPIAPSVTPAASQALDLIGGMAQQLGLRPGEGPTLQQVNLIRKGISNLYGSTGQNGTDRAALGAVRDAFDRHVQDMTEIGMFRSGSGASRNGGAGDDLFSARIPRAADGAGAAAPPPGAMVLSEARAGEPESFARYVARNGGVPLDAEARAADLHRTYSPGGGTLARNGGRSFDDWRVKLVEDGWLPYRDAYDLSPADVADRMRAMIARERIGGGRNLRLDDEARGLGGREAGRIADENAMHAGEVEREARKLAIDLEGFGIAGASLDRAALRSAAEARVLGHADDGIAAYEQAAARGQGVASRAEPPPDVPFPGLGEGTGPAGAPFPAGDTGPAEAMRNARGLFRDYKIAFTPRGPGDVAGQRLQRIVERDASPNEAVSMLFGTTTGRVSPGQAQTLARLREAVGGDSEAWHATQQALIARYVSGDGRDLAGRLDYLLRGEGRTLSQFLTPEQRGGLGQLRAAVAQTESAQTAAPAWVQDLERSGFDPNRIASSLFGSGVPGSRPGALNEAKAAKAFLGADSAEWSGLRQAAVQRITGMADQTMKAGKIVEQVRAFTDGSGAGLARELFSGEELGHFRRYAAALQSTLRPEGARQAPGVAGQAVARALDVLAGAVAFKAGGPAGAAAAYGVRPGTRFVTGGLGARSTRQSFEGGAPRVRASLPALPTDRLAIGSGEYAGQR